MSQCCPCILIPGRCEMPLHIVLPAFQLPCLYFCLMYLDIKFPMLFCNIIKSLGNFSQCVARFLNLPQIFNQCHLIPVPSIEEILLDNAFCKALSCSVFANKSSIMGRTSCPNTV